MSKKNILIIASKFPPEYSGPGVRIPKLYNAIKDKIENPTISVLCNGLEKPYNESYKHNGWNVQRLAAESIRKKSSLFRFLPKTLINNIAYTAETISTLNFLKENHKKHPYDLFHILGHSGATAAALSFANKNNIPVMIELVTDKARPCQKYLNFFKSCPPENSALITFRTDIEQRCRKAGYKEQTWNRPNPIDESIFKIPDLKEKEELRKKLTPFSKDDIVLSSVAKIIPQKNQIFLIDVMARLPEHFKLIIAGPIVKEGPLLERDRAYFQLINKKIKSLNLTSRIQIIPDYVSAAEFMKLSDIYMLPAYNEGFGTPMLEANACGIPVIANEGEYAFREWIKNGENGFTAPLKAEDWATCCQKAALFSAEQREEQARKITALAGQKTIYKHYIYLIKQLMKI